MLCKDGRCSSSRFKSEIRLLTPLRTTVHPQTKMSSHIAQLNASTVLILTAMLNHVEALPRPNTPAWSVISDLTDVAGLFKRGIRQSAEQAGRRKINNALLKKILPPVIIVLVLAILIAFCFIRARRQRQEKADNKTTDGESKTSSDQP